MAPFFEVRDVNQPPQVASRVEPRLPAELQNQPVREIVIVRVLVSQTGHPAFVNLLRRSKAGLALDDAVVAAVKQWTFSPARRRGEAVSCWYHVGVQVNGQ
jgi:protein TonB